MSHSSGFGLRSDGARVRAARGATAASLALGGVLAVTGVSPLGAQGLPPVGTAVAADSAAGRTPPLVLRIETPDTVKSGEPVRVRLTLVNQTDGTLPLVYGGTGAGDFGIAVRTAPTGQPIWTSHSNQVHLSIAIAGSLPPHGSRKFEVTWPQVTNSGARVLLGTYYVSGGLYASVPRHSATEERRSRSQGVVSDTKAVTIAPP